MHSMHITSWCCYDFLCHIAVAMYPMHPPASLVTSLHGFGFMTMPIALLAAGIWHWLTGSRLGSFGVTRSRLDSLDLTWTHLNSHDLTWTHLDSLDLTWSHVISLRLTWTQLISLELTWPHLDSLGLTWSHLDSLDPTWTQLRSLDFTWTHLASLDITWTHLDSRGFTWTHLISFGLTWSHLDSLDLIYLKGKGTQDLTREKGRNLEAKREKAKGSESLWRSILTLHAAARARTDETKRFPSWLTPQPPINVHMQVMYTTYTCIYILDIQIYMYIYNIIYTGTHLLTPPPSLIAIAIRCIYIVRERERERIQGI